MLKIVFLVRCFDILNDLIIEISFAKGKKSKNGNNSLFKIMQGYGNNSNKKNVYNVGIPINHFFWIRMFDINSGELINKKYCSYYELVNLLEINNIYNLTLASKQKEKNKTPEELKIIKREYEKYKQWYQNEYPNYQNKKENSKIKKEKTIKSVETLETDVGKKIVIQNILD
ncbi:hypothetical protein [Spiroplasma endosymbiont of Cantharis lateralis]|uniref:hypothetical protein n=1 Tax=Spiroplasma endosymbiont of Cantharis lateralis TaxID=3066277 RepID=UPI00313C2117